MIFAPAEISTFIGIIFLFVFFRFVLKKNIFGEFVTAAFLGIFFEIATEPNWDYNLNYYLYKDVSPIIMVGWGVSIPLVVTASEWAYKKIFKKEKVNIWDKKLFITDALVGMLLFTGVEYLGINILHGWTYSPVMGWTINIPFINLPLEAILGLGLFSLVLPTFVRHWHRRFDLVKNQK